MKNRALIIAIAITVLAAVSPAPRANADPLTIMAIVGLVTVASISTAGVVAEGGEADTRDFRAQHEEAETRKAAVEPADEATAAAARIEVAAR
jgi:hypothetical protein